MDKQASLRLRILDGLLGLGILAATILGFIYVPNLYHAIKDPEVFYFSCFEMRYRLLLWGVFLGILCLLPLAVLAVKSLRRSWCTGYTYISLSAVCIFLSGFIVHFGRWQYGGWDFNILVDTGWREVLGQHAFVDYVTPNPPAFNLGIKMAFKLFGVNWDANLYLTAIFSCLTFLWMYWLMVRLFMDRVAAIIVAFGVECVAILPLCFWWYNDTTLVMAAVFFLSCLVVTDSPCPLSIELSYVLSLALLSLMKPNIAGVLIAGGALFVVLAGTRRLRLIGLTAVAAVLAIGILIASHVSIAAMLSSYASVAKTRGGIGARFGYRQMPPPMRHAALLWIALLVLPLLGTAPQVWNGLMRREWKTAIRGLFLLMGLIVALYGLATNGEFPDAECTVLLVAGAVAVLAFRWGGRPLRYFYIAMLCSMMVGDLYYGASRVRVYGIGPHVFFEWRDNRQQIDNRFFKNLYVSSRLAEVEREVSDAVKANPGPVFFGPRMDFNYAVFGLPSPTHWPVYWQPGTSFALSEEGPLTQNWQEHRFNTLIFLKEDDPKLEFNRSSMGYTFYSDDLLQVIRSEYVADERFPMITVFHRRQ